jgi:hypothetical protein
VDRPNLLPQPRIIEPGHGRAPVMEPEVHVDESLPPEGYELRVTPRHIDVRASDAAGVFYAHHTLHQLAQTEGASLPVCRIRDWPDFAVRGVMLDVSRDKVPTMETLRDLVDRLSGLKVNQIQLYMEHTYAYPDHEEVWRDASPFTSEEIRELDRYCRDRHVELVPNQNTLGHMERWLRHERYRPLALAPDGWTDWKGRSRPPTTLDPSKHEALRLVRGLLDTLLPQFDSRRVHVGLDEPWELPRRRVPDYLEWIRELRELPELTGYEMLIWSDVLGGSSALLAEVPTGVTVCEWGYDSGHPFHERAALYEQAGVPFWVCPGTSSWISILGRTENARANCSEAASAALAHGGVGFLNTDWGDLGHLQYLPISEPGFAYGAAVSWCHDTNRDIDLAAALDAHVFGDGSGELGHAILELGDVHQGLGSQFPNMATLVTHLYFPQTVVGKEFTEGVEVAEFEAIAARLDELERRVMASRPQRDDGPLLLDELGNAIALARLACRDAAARLAGDGTLGSVPQAARVALAADLDRIIARHRELWLARNRPGGLADSVSWLDNLRLAYDTGRPDPNWGNF